MFNRSLSIAMYILAKRTSRFLSTSTGKPSLQPKPNLSSSQRIVSKLSQNTAITLGTGLALLGLGYVALKNSQNKQITHIEDKKKNENFKKLSTPELITPQTAILARGPEIEKYCDLYNEVIRCEGSRPCMNELIQKTENLKILLMTNDFLRLRHFIDLLAKNKVIKNTYGNTELNKIDPVQYILNILSENNFEKKFLILKYLMIESGRQIQYNPDNVYIMLQSTLNGIVEQNSYLEDAEIEERYHWKMDEKTSVINFCILPKKEDGLIQPIEIHWSTCIDAKLRKQIEFFNHLVNEKISDFNPSFLNDLHRYRTRLKRAYDSQRYLDSMCEGGRTISSQSVDQDATYLEKVTEFERTYILPKLGMTANSNKVVYSTLKK